MEKKMDAINHQAYGEKWILFVKLKCHYDQDTVKPILTLSSVCTSGLTLPFWDITSGYRLFSLKRGARNRGPLTLQCYFANHAIVTFIPANDTTHVIRCAQSFTSEIKMFLWSYVMITACVTIGFHAVFFTGPVILNYVCKTTSKDSKGISACITIFLVKQCLCQAIAKRRVSKR